MIQSADAEHSCPQCDGRLKECQHGKEYECSNCGNTIRAAVVDRLEHFKRAAEGDGQLARIAQAALDGDAE